MDAAEISDARSYYRKILRFYALEAVSRAHLDFWRRIARRLAPKRILEIGSGLGRITTALSQIAPAVGIDVSMEMLARAPRSQRPHLVLADARRVTFRAAFDLVVAPGDPLSHLTTLADRRRVLRAVSRQLVPGGTFVLEGLYRRRHAVTQPHRRIRHAGGVLTIEEGWFPAGIGDLWHARYHYVDRKRDGSEETLSAAFLARAWNRRTIQAEFAAAGLRIDSVHGDFEGRPFTPAAKRLMVFARKPR